jgi:hypothetical protein
MENQNDTCTCQHAVSTMLACPVHPMPDHSPRYHLWLVNRKTGDNERLTGYADTLEHCQNLQRANRHRPDADPREYKILPAMETMPERMPTEKQACSNCFWKREHAGLTRPCAGCRNPGTNETANWLPDHA